MALRVRLLAATALASVLAAPVMVRADDTPSALDALEDKALREEARAKYEEALKSFEEAFSVAVKEAAAAGADPKAGRLRARAEVYLEKIDDVADRADAHRRAEEFLRPFKAEELGPALKGRVDWERVSFLRKAGNPKEAAEVLGGLGFVSKWWVVGPFDNERSRGYAQKMGPEGEKALEVDLAADYPGKERRVRWRAVPAVHPYGWIDLEAMMRPNDQALAYAATWIKADAAREVCLRFGSEESLKVWVNGTQVLDREVVRRGGFDQDSVGVALSAGWNRVVVKCGTSIEKSPRWGFRMRVTDAAGNPITDVATPSSDEELKTAASDPANAAQAKIVPADRGALDALEPAAPRGATADEGSEDARAYFWLGLLHRSRQYDDQQKAQIDRKYLERASKLRPDDPIYRFHAAEAAARPIEMSVEKEENTQRRGREKAVELDPQYAAAYLALANYYTHSLKNLPRAEELCRKALEVNDVFLEAHLLLVEILRQRGFATESGIHLDRTLSRPEFAARTATLREKARIGDRNGVMAAAADACRKALDVDAEDADARGRLAEVLKKEALAEDAVGVFDERVRLNPFDVDAHRHKAHFLEGLERFPQAAAAAAEGLALAPEDENLLDLQARVLHKVGKQADAVAKWREALKVNPKNAVLKRYVEWLDPSLRPFELPYVEDAASLLAAVRGREDANPENDPSIVVLDKGVTRVNPDGTNSAFTQRIIKILNNQGVKENARYRAGSFWDDEQSFEWRAARVWRKDGSVEEAQVQAGSPGVRWPQLQPGDAIEVQHRVDQTEQSFFGDYYGDQWYFAERVPVLRSEWTLLVPESREIRYHSRNMPEGTAEPKTGTVDDGKFRSYTWALKDRPKIRFEPAMPDPGETYPVVEVTTFKDWDQFATWWWNLIKKQFTVDDGMRAKVEELTKGKETRLEKVRAIYDFVVTDIQYQAWEFGVHGYKPYTATSIFNRKFGDCKDKAILIRTMLDMVGVEAYPVLIMASQSRSEEDMTIAQVGKFNHCIAYVPDADGTGKAMFLDGTAQYNSLHNVPSMDRGAEVLIVKPEGAERVVIPWNTPEEMLFGQEFEVALEPTGAAMLRGKTVFTGDWSVMARSLFSVEGKRDLVLAGLLGQSFGKHKIEKKEFPDLKDIGEPKVEIGLDVRVDGLGQVQGNRMTLPVKFVDFGILAQLQGLAALEKREHDMVLMNPMSFTVRANIKLPEGWTVATLPDARTIESPFAKFVVSCKAEGGSILLDRTVQFTKHRVASEMYPQFREFVSKANAAMTEKIVLEKAAAPDAPK